MDPALLTHEIEALGEQLSRERLDRKAEADHLKLELYAMLSCLKQLVPDFERLFVETYDDVRQKLDPESPQALRSR